MGEQPEGRRRRKAKHGGFGSQFDPRLLQILLCALGGMAAVLVLMSLKLIFPALGFNSSGPGYYLSALWQAREPGAAQGTGSTDSTDM